METKRELNDILINDDDLQKQNRTKRLMMMIAMALIFLFILIAVVFVVTRDEEELSERQMAANSGLTPLEPSDPFVQIPLETKETEKDPFQQVLEDIRNRAENNQVAQSTTTQEPTPPRQPIVENKPTQQPVLPSKPVSQPTQTQPAKPVKPANMTATTNTTKEPTKPAQTAAPKPATTKPTTTPTTATPLKPAQATQSDPNNIASIFSDVSTPQMDTSKNGQIAEKGFYLQVGSFTNKPNAEFLKQISNYSYRVYMGTSTNGQATTKYLIGPYKSRTEASRDLPNFKALVPDPVHFEVK
ncbi:MULTISPECIES: SPOR domain-containing protein [Helicobacter]|uniref:SPOR domain-containing protein n=1 Tax=Helicobacter typhlonius TaxID=76936 RepID=A0A099UGH7_9HELI|nr:MULTISPECIES: SPOR domain-containing protein [Helicobacter]TLD78589.1 SPOR domain-containing protein [Helicobacter typhlonius]TLD89341.1 SPOR domain-containing protein [Helicobacter sp. MIT 03-1616]CUU40166.1 Hypothetical protein BN2458_PEG1281 [Helicobacter typhlonius]